MEVWSVATSSFDQSPIHRDRFLTASIIWGGNLRWQKTEATISPIWRLIGTLFLKLYLCLWFPPANGQSSHFQFRVLNLPSRPAFSSLHPMPCQLVNIGCTKDESNFRRQIRNPQFKVRSASHLDRDIYNISDGQQTKGSWHLVISDGQHSKVRLADCSILNVKVKSKGVNTAGTGKHN